MDDLISRQNAIRWVKTECNPYGKPSLDYESGVKVIDHLEKMPSAQPERKKGRWEMLQIRINPPIYKCSECGSHALQVQTGCLMNRHYEAVLTNFCHNCGADMRGEDNG